VIFEKLFETYRKEILHSRLLMVEGKVQKEGEVVHVIVSKCFDFTKLLKGLTIKDDDQLPILTLSRADEKSPPYPAENKCSRGIQCRIFIKQVFTAGRTKVILSAEFQLMVPMKNSLLPKRYISIIGALIFKECEQLRTPKPIHKSYGEN